MQHTKTYNLSIIDPDDAFSPDALNDNARTLEAQLARVDAALLAEQTARESADAAEKSARESADAAKAPQTEISRLETALSAETAAREAADAAEKSARESAAAAEKSRVDAALAAETAARTADTARLDAAIGPLGNGVTSARIVTGTYKGTGKYGSGSSNRNSLDFAATLGCAPKLLIVEDGTSGYSLIAVNGSKSAFTLADGTSISHVCYLTWTDTGVSWYHSIDASIQMNLNRTYYYVAFA